MAKRRDALIARAKTLVRLGQDKDCALKKVKTFDLHLGDEEEFGGSFVSMVVANAHISGRKGMQMLKMPCRVKPGASIDDELKALHGVVTKIMLEFAAPSKPEPETNTDPVPPAEPPMNGVETCPHCKRPVVPVVNSAGRRAGEKKCPDCSKFFADAEGGDD